MKAEKKALRQEMVQRRARVHGSVDPTPAVEALTEALKTAEEPISFYWPIRTEIDPRPAMRAMAKTHDVCLPVTNGHGPLTFRAWEEGTTMQTDGFGVSTPDASAPEVLPKTLVVPMLAFDFHCHRLGYGAGHYDRTLAKLQADEPVRTIGFAYAAQGVDGLLPTEPTDQALDMIITETMTIRA